MSELIGWGSVNRCSNCGHSEQISGLNDTVNQEKTFGIICWGCMQETASRPTFEEAVKEWNQSNKK